MTTNPYQTMAREFLDLWQKQMASIVSDKEFIAAMLDMVQTMQNPGKHGKKTAAADTANAPDADDGNMARLAFRLAMCERRIAELEAKCTKPKAIRKRAAGRNKKPR